MQVEIWSDVVCPWCYLGKQRFEQALTSFPHREQVNVVYRSFELDPEAPTGQTTPTVELLAGKYGLSPADAENAQRQMEQRAAADGLSFRMDGLHSGNTRAAHRLLHWAAEQNRQAELIDRLYRAYFSEQTSVFDNDVLARLAGDVGLDAAQAAQVLASDDYADAVAADQAEARALGANGVPFFVIDRRYGISGAQPAELIGQALERAWDETSA